MNVPYDIVRYTERALAIIIMNWWRVVATGGGGWWYQNRSSNRYIYIYLFHLIRPNEPTKLIFSGRIPTFARVRGEDCFTRRCPRNINKHRSQSVCWHCRPCIQIAVKTFIETNRTEQMDEEEKKKTELIVSRCRLVEWHKKYWMRFLSQLHSLLMLMIQTFSVQTVRMPTRVKPFESHSKSRNKFSGWQRQNCVRHLKCTSDKFKIDLNWWLPSLGWTGTNSTVRN